VQVPHSRAILGALHSRTSFWLKQGIFNDLSSFEDFERRVNRLPEEKDRGDVFEIFIEGYLATQPIAQCVKHWVVGGIPLALREKYRLPSDLLSPRHSQQHREEQSKSPG
jgi:hypothetical protein